MLSTTAARMHKNKLNNLAQRVERSILQRGLLLPQEHVLVAVSGGADSMVLLQLLSTLSGKHGWQLAVAHADHALRDMAGREDALFVKEYTTRLGLTFRTQTLPVREAASESGSSLEMTGRRLRHEFLARTARELGIHKVAVAHHADDQVELFFLRALRGSGSDGLSGMQWMTTSPADKGLTLVRPLLGVTREEVLTWARDSGLKYREDASNLCMDFQRNRLRHELLPLLRAQYQPGLTDVVLRTMELLRAEAEALDAQAVSWLERLSPQFRSLPVAIQRRVIQLQLLRKGELPDFDLIEGLRSRHGKAQTAAGGRRWVLSPDSAVLEEKAPRPAFMLDQVELSLGKTGVATLGGCHVSWKLEKVSGSTLPTHRNTEQVFDADSIGTNIKLRHWQPGDRFQPIGRRTSVKLQDLFTNAKIPMAERRKLLVAQTASGQLFWVENLRISEAHKVTERTIRRLHWQWQRH